MQANTNRLKKLNILPISWFEIKDFTFFYKCKAGSYDLTLEDSHVFVNNQHRIVDSGFSFVTIE